MSGITYIKRIDGATNSLVQINTSDTTAAALAVGYLAAQAANITAVNDGVFTFLANDEILLVASDGNVWCTLNSTFSTLLVAVQGGAWGYVQTAPTLANFIANYSAPLLIIPAQGVNTMVIVDSIQIVQTYGSAALATGGAVTPQYGSTVHGGGVAAGTTVAAADFQQTASTVYPIIGISGSGTFLLEATCKNVGIYLSNPTADFTAGTASTFLVKSYFHVISLVS